MLLELRNCHDLWLWMRLMLWLMESDNIRELFVVMFRVRRRQQEISEMMDGYDGDIAISGT